MRERDRRQHPAIDGEHRRALELLRAAGDSALPIAALEHAGVRNPATVVYELELRGYLIRHVPGDRGRPDFRFDGIAEGAAANALPPRAP